MSTPTYVGNQTGDSTGDTTGTHTGPVIGNVTGNLTGGAFLRGTTRYVNSAVSASGTGLTWATAYKTITEAVAAASAGDNILMIGSFTEAVTCSLAGVKFIGAGTDPNECVWTGAADAKCLTPTGDDILVQNIKFRPPAYSADRATCAISLSGSNYLTIRGCRFQGKTGSQAAIYSAVCDSDNVRIQDCEFIYMNTATYGCAIKGVEAGGLSYSGWVIERCRFNSCLIGIDVNMRVGTIRDCIFMEYGINAAGALAQLLGVAIDLSGTSSGGNHVYGNQFPGDYSTARFIPGASGDAWVGNFCDDTSETEVGDNGVSIANPAA